MFYSWNIFGMKQPSSVPLLLCFIPGIFLAWLSWDENSHIFYKCHVLPKHQIGLKRQEKLMLLFASCFSWSGSSSRMDAELQKTCKTSKNRPQNLLEKRLMFGVRALPLRRAPSAVVTERAGDRLARSVLAHVLQPGSVTRGHGDAGEAACLTASRLGRRGRCLCLGVVPFQGGV